MNIAIIGAGNIGGALGMKWAKAGHNVRYGLRKPDDADCREFEILLERKTRGAIATDMLIELDRFLALDGVRD